MALVGTRTPSPYGTEVAYALGRGLGASGVPVVAGSRSGSTPARIEAASTAAASRSPCSLAGPTSHIPAGTGASTSGSRAGHRDVRAAAGHPAVSLELSGTESDHGRARADDRRRRGRAAEREPDHRRVRPRARPRVAAVPGWVTSVRRAGANDLCATVLSRHRPEDVLDELFGVGVRSRPRLLAGGAASTTRCCWRCSRPPSSRARSTRSPVRRARSGRRARRLAGSRPTATWCGATWTAGSGRRDDAAHGADRSAKGPPILTASWQTDIPRALSIAGSDSGGGAGIQADLKAFARCGVHGMTAVTAITAQNTVAVTAVYQLPPDAIVEQVRAVAEDIGVDAVKIGMLGNAETIEAVDAALDLLGAVPVVLDPVMVAESGARLLDEGAQQALRNAAAAARAPSPPRTCRRQPLLAGRGRRRAPSELARGVHALGPAIVVVTGGHASGPPTSSSTATRLVEIGGERHPDGAAHGSGCTHSSALAAHLALGVEPLEAARRAKAIASEAVSDGLRRIGAGAGPVDALGLAGPRAGTLDAAGDARDRSGRHRARGIIGRGRAGGPNHDPPLLRGETDQVPAHEAGPRRGAARRGRPAGAGGRGAARRGVPASARRGHVGGGADHRPRRAVGARPRSSRDYGDIPSEAAERVIFFPRASGG